MAKIKKSKREYTDGILIPGKDDRESHLAWNILFFASVAALVLLPVFLPRPYLDILSFLPDGLLVTFEVTLLSIFCALLLGVLTVFGRISRIRLLNHLSALYTEVVRGIPLLVQIFYIYFAVGKFLQLPPLVSAVMAMSICYGAYIGEILRAGVQAIPKGQMEAAVALGMSRWQAIRMIIMPQVFKIVLPPIGNEFIALLKDSSLVSIIAVADVFRRAREYASKTFDYFESYTVVAIVYLVLTLFFSRIVAMMEKKVSADGK